MVHPQRPQKYGESLIQEMKDTHVPYGMIAVWFLGQESVVIKGGAITLYIDPYVSDYLEREHGSVRTYPAPIAPEHITNADYYLITHEHLDHLDPGTVSVVAGQSPQTVFLAPAVCRSELIRLGVNDEKLFDAFTDNWWQQGDLRILPIPAAHEELDEDARFGHRFVGYVIELNGVKLYHAGDTTIYPGLLERLQQQAIQLGMLPINGRDAYRFRRNIIGNMNYREAAQLAADAKFDLVIPLHYDVFAGNSEHPGYFVDFLYDHYPEQRCHVMARSERFIYVGQLESPQ